MLGSCKDRNDLDPQRNGFNAIELTVSILDVTPFLSSRVLSTGRTKHSASSRYPQTGNACSSTRRLVNGALQLPVADHSRRNPRSKCGRGERSSGRDSRAHDWLERGLFPRSHRSSTAILSPLGVEVQVPESSTPPIGAEVVARNGIICP